MSPMPVAPKTNQPDPALCFARAVERGRTDEEELARALRDSDDPRHHLALIALRERVAQLADAASSRRCAALLPTTISAEPASAILLAELYRRLWRWLPTRALPDWRSASEAPGVLLAWLRTEACTSPLSIADPSSETASELAEALAELDLESVDDPAALISTLAARAEQGLQRIALELLRAAIDRAAITPEAAHRIAVGLLHTSPELITSALELLAQPWSQALPLGAVELRSSLAAGETVARAALRCAAARGLEGPLRALLDDPEAPPRLRQEAMRALGSVAGRPAVQALLGAALADPLLLGRPCVDALTALHRRAAFVTDADAGALLDLYAQTSELRAEELVDIAYTSRKALFAALRDRPPEALDADRRMELARALAQAPQGATPLPVRAWLLDLCRGEGVGGATSSGSGSTDGPASRAWPDEQDEQDDADAELAHATRDADASAHANARLSSAALRTLAHLGVPEAEALALARLDEDPATALRALRYVGSAAAATALAAALGLAPEGPTRGSLLPHTRTALELLWQLTADDGVLRERLLERMDDHELTPVMLRDLGSVFSPRAADILARRARRHRPQRTPLGAAIVAIERLTRERQTSLLPELREHLRACVRAVADGEVDDESLRGEAQRIVPSAVLDALRGLGAWLRERGRIRPTTLLGVAEGSAADTFTAGLLLDILILPERRGAPSDEAEIEVILRTLGELTAPQIYPAVLPLLRSDSPTLRKLVLPLLSRHGGQALATSIRVLTRADDDETLRQAVIALGELGDPSGVEALIATLEHRNMNIKKAAAVALGQVRSPEAIPRLLWWLGHHDNPGLREHLQDALRGTLGSTTSMTLLAAAQAADAPRRRGLLLDALAPTLDPLAIRSVLRADLPWLGELVARIPPRRELGPLIAELEAAGLRPTPKPSPVPANTLCNLARDGLSPAVETELLTLRRERPLTPAEGALLAPHLGEWLDLAAAAKTPRGHLQIALEALPRPLAAEHRQTLSAHRETLIAGLIAATRPLAGRLVELLTSLGDELGPGQAWLLGTSLRDALRRPFTNHSGRSLLTLLRRCGITLVRADIDDALASAERSPDPRDLARRILADAFLHRELAPTRNTLKKGPKQALERAAKTRRAAEIESLQTTWTADPKPTITALIDTYVEGDPQLRPALLGWLCELQPPGAPLRRAVPCEPNDRGRRPRADDLDQPLCAALLRRLCRDLDDPQRCKGAATALLQRAEALDPSLRQRLVQGFLGGELGAGPGANVSHDLLPVLAAALAELPLASFAELLRQHLDDLAWLGRLSRLLRFPAARRDPRVLGHLLETWPRADLDHRTRDLLQAMIQAFDREVVRIAVQGPLLRGEWGTFDLLQRPLRRSTLDEELLAAARPEDRERLESHLSALRRPTERVDDPRAQKPPKEAEQTDPEAPPRSREELLLGLRAADRRAPQEQLLADLKRLSRAPDPTFLDLCRELIGHPLPRLRLAAYRHLRRHGSREDSREAARRLLADPRPDVQRSAIASLGHARDPVALPTLVDLLTSRHKSVRKAALAALKLYGAPARDALRTAMHRARPDHRRRLQELAASLDESADAAD